MTNMAGKRKTKTLVEDQQSDGEDILSIGAMETIRLTLSNCTDVAQVRAALADLPADYVMGVHEILMVSLNAVLED